MSSPRTFADGLFDGKQALICGGTSGIGAAIGNALAALGAQVTVTGGSPAEVERATAAPGYRARSAIALDVRDADAITRTVDAFERLDILANCAGMVRRGAEHRVDVFEDVIDVNLSGTMRMCVAARSRLAASGGCIVNIASILSFFGGGLVPGYSASKGGIAQLTKSLAIAYAADGIRVNALAPGWIATPLTQALQNDTVRSQAILSRTPMGRWGDPAEIADTAVFLCSPAARFMTGTIMIVDGGYAVT